MSVNIYDSSTDTLTRVDNSSGLLVKTTVAKTGTDQSAVTDTIAASTTMDNAIGTLLNNDVTLGSDIQTLTNHLTTENLGTITSLSALETAITNLIPNVGSGEIKPITFSNTNNFGAPFPNVTGQWTGYIQPSGGNRNSGFVKLYCTIGYPMIGFDNAGTFTWYEDGFDGSTVKTRVAKTGSGSALTTTIAARTSLDNSVGTLLNNDVALNSNINNLKHDIAQINVTGDTNNSGVAISPRTWFKKDGKLYRSLESTIPVNGTLTYRTNYDSANNITRGALQLLGFPVNIYNGGKTNDGTTKTLTHNIQRFRYILIELVTNSDFDQMFFDTDYLRLNSTYLRTIIAADGAGKVSSFPYQSTAKIVFLSNTTFKCTAVSSNANWTLGVNRIFGIF